MGSSAQTRKKTSATRASPPELRGPDLRDDALDLHSALTDLVRAYQSREREAVCCYDVSLGQSHALERLARLGPLSLNEFAASLFLEKSSATRLVDGLERKGYVTRRPNQEDARFVQIELTRRGRLLANKLEEDIIRERGEMLSELRAAERQVVIRALARLADIAASRATSGDSR